MLVRDGVVLIRVVGVYVDVGVSDAVVLVDVAVDVRTIEAAKADQSDADEDEADQAFAPRGEKIDGNGLAEGQGREGQQPYAAGVPDTPKEADAPRVCTLVDGQRRHGRQVVGAGKDVARAGDEARDQR